MDVDLYKQCIDVISSGKSDAEVISELGNLGIDFDAAANMASEYHAWFGRTEISGKDGIIDGLKSIGKEMTEQKYGFCGKAARWEVGNVIMEGGAGQLNSVFSWGTLGKSGIVKFGENIIIN